MKTFNLPDLGEGLQEAEIVTWHVKEGDSVKVDQPLVSVETAKAVVDVPSPWAGKITKLHGKEGDIMPTHGPLVDFDLPDDGGAKPAGAKAASAAAGKSEPIAEDSGTVVGAMPTGDDILEETAVIRRKKTVTGTTRVKALPSVRLLARELGIDLGALEGSGKNGQITRNDVEQAGSSQPADITGQSFAYGMDWQLPPLPAGVTYGRAEPLRGPRRAMHQSMSDARSKVMECTLFDDADINGWIPGQDITVRIIRSIVAGCRTEPVLNAWYDGDKMERVLHKHVDLAMAVDTPEGLIVPVLRQVQAKNARQLRDELNRVKLATRNRTVAPADMKNPTITLSNFGMMAGRYATPVVVPPQVAILGTGGIRYDVVPVLGGIETHKRIPLSITFDHRCVTGGEACRWLAAVIADLQKPA